MTATATARRTLEIELTHESDPLFRYGQRLIFRNRQTGTIIGWEHIDQETWDKYEGLEGDAPELGWHYSVRRDSPGSRYSIEILSESLLLRLLQG